MPIELVSLFFAYLSCCASFLLLCPIILEWKIIDVCFTLLRDIGLRLNERALHNLESELSSTAVVDEEQTRYTKYRIEKVRKVIFPYKEEIDRIQNENKKLNVLFIILSLCTFVSILSEMYYYTQTQNIIINSFESLYLLEDKKLYWIISILSGITLFFVGIRQRIVSFHNETIKYCKLKAYVCLFPISIPIIGLYYTYNCEFLFFCYPVLSYILSILGTIYLESMKIFLLLFDAKKK